MKRKQYIKDFLLSVCILLMAFFLNLFMQDQFHTQTMIPVIASLATEMGCDPTVFYFGLLPGATLGGNCTPIGASANITGIGILRKSGYTVKNSDFFKIGIPFTLATIIPAYIYLWIFYGI